MSIPRISKLFFQTSKAPLEPYLIKMTKSMLGEDWTYLHFLDSDILEFLKSNPREEFPGAIDIFKKLKRGEHKADFFRYYFIFIKGGVFMDSDAMIYSPIDRIVKDYRFISVNSQLVPGSIFQGILGAEPNNPVIKQALEFFFSNDLSALDSNYHLLCKGLFKIYQENPEKEGYHLFQEIGDMGGDRITDSGELLFRHYWRNKEGIPNTLKSRNLIYCCVFYNKDYFRLLELLLKSMKIFSTLDSFDFLVMTSPEFVPLVQGIGRTLNLDIKTFTQNFSTIFQAACARLFIFDYPEIKGYEKILYIDTDIIIKSNLDPIFDLPIQDLLYGIESGTISSLSFGGQFFDFENSEIKREMPGINSGTLLFLNSKTIQELFSRIRLHVESFTREGNTPPYCMDQPFINFHAISNSLYDNSLLNPLVSLFEGNDTVLNYNSSSICHFSFPIGNFGHKFSRMSDFLSKTLSIQSHSYLCSELIGQKYSWGPSGFIKFLIDESYQIVLETPWGKGTVQVLGDKRFLVEWNSYQHVLKFNEDFTSYKSLRINPRDFDYSTGSLKTSNLNIYGDSHGLMLFKGLQIEHRNLFEFGRTMFRVGRDQQILNFTKEHNNPNRIFCLAYGEVDVRAHIGRQVYYGRHHTSVCMELVSEYIKAIKANIVEYKAIVIVAIPPPVDPKDHTHTHEEPIPFIGTNSDRIIYTNDINELLEVACKENGYYFLNPYDIYKGKDGTLKYELSDNCIHIGKNEQFLKAFTKLCELIEDPQIPIVLHTCDSYKKFWNPWFYYCKKFLKDYKIYFLTEEEEPDFSSEVICIKTGKEEWGERLLRGLKKIPEKNIYYMQEDFWPCKPMDLQVYNDMFVNYQMDALRIDGRSYLYSLNPIKGKLYKFQQNSQYLMTHQFSLWNKEFLSKNINPKHNPWISEIEQSKTMATKPHSIYLYDEQWYNAVVKKGILQTNGEQMVKDMLTAEKKP